MSPYMPLILAALFMTGCQEARGPAHSVEIVNFGSQTIYSPTLNYGKAEIFVDGSDRLSARMHEGDFADFIVPEIAYLRWISKGYQCRSTFAVKEAVDEIADFPGAYLYFDINDRESKAYIDRELLPNDDPFLIVKRLTQYCVQIANWKPPDASHTRYDLPNTD